jgi:hypothetical protein
MAFGFQNCCDGTEYFYVNGIPSSVSELEVYYIDTEEGLDFCASYVELPELFYQPKTYNLVGMTAQTNCLSCTTSHPCPDIIDDNIDELSSYITTTTNECAVITESFFEVSCVQTSVPTFSNTNGGIISLNISGGVPPYFIYSSNTTTQLSSSVNPGIVQVLTNKPGGTYLFDVVDFTSNVLNISCTLPSAPTLLSSSCNKIDVSGFFGNTNGQILQPSVNGGTPPYTYWSGSTQITTFPITNLAAGTYNLTIKDSGVGINFQQVTISCVIIDSVEQIVYPSNLCMSFEFCGTGFLINFVSAGTLNNKAYYTPDAAGRNSLGVGTLFQLSWNNSQWVTNSVNKISSVSLAGGCSPAGTTVGFTGPTSQQPNGSWSPISNTFFNNDGGGVTQINVSSTSCNSTPLSVTAIVNDGTCSPTPNGTITLTVNNGTPPYLVFFGGVNNNGNLSITGLGSGTFTWSVTDSTNRSASGVSTLNVPIQSNIEMTIIATYSNSQNVVNVASPTKSRQISRTYNLSVSISGLGNGESIQGYFTVKYKQLALYKNAVNDPNFNQPYDSTVYVPGNTIDLNTLTGPTSGIVWSKSNTGVFSNLTLSPTTIESGFYNRRCPAMTICTFLPIPTSIMPAAQNNGCPTTTNQAAAASISYTVGSSLSPITFSNGDVIATSLLSEFKWRPNTTGTNGEFVAETTCRRAYAEDWEIYFTLTSSLPICKNLLINSSPYTNSNPQSTLYRRSLSIVDNQAYSDSTINALYNNGAVFNAINSDSTQRVTVF